MHSPAIGAFTAGRFAGAAVFSRQRAAPFPSFSVGFIAVAVKFFTCFSADRSAILIQIKGVFINILSKVPFVEVNEGLDIFLKAVTVNRVCVVCGIQQELGNVVFREPCLHGEKGMQEGKHVMTRSALQHWEYWQVILRISSHKHIKMVAIKITVPGRVPSDIAVRLGKFAFTAAVLLSTGTDFFKPRPGLCADRRPITGKRNVIWVDESFVNGTVEELLRIKAENKGERTAFRPFLRVFAKKFDEACSSGFIDIRSFIAMLFAFGSFLFHITLFRGEVIGIRIPNAGKKVVKSTDAWDMARGEATEDGIKRAFLKLRDPVGYGRYFKFQGQQVGAQHAGWLPRGRSVFGISLSKNLVSRGKVQEPELDNDAPGLAGDGERVRVIFQEIFHEEVLPI